MLVKFNEKYKNANSMFFKYLHKITEKYSIGLEIE